MGNDIYCWWNQILYFLLNSFSKEPKVVIKQYLHVLSFTGHGWISLNWSGNLFVIIKRRSGLYSNAAKTINLHNILDLQVKNVDETTDLINLVVVRKMNGLIQTIAIKGSHQKKRIYEDIRLKGGRMSIWKPYYWKVKNKNI